MSEDTSRNVLAELEAFEAAAFRVGQLARRLRTDHPDLPVQTMLPTVWALASSAGPDVHAELEIHCDSVDGAHACAAVLGVEATVTIAGSGYERAAAKAVVNGIKVKVSGTRSLTGDEYRAWRAEQDQAAAEAETAGGAQ
ncbi:hypothetical protein E4N62_46675 [Streptomyces sp. MNU76]|uniref:hypothetical protein n=1 Tax=Streptomyces sp. MNU76 TaxID=2560026 RepID=UPI001E3B7525|nr:hypothetical protein [Streptomyces sp. MNU76]MCC9712042.1 hypothetical protein [Streptomyces sp. MNU76]